LTTKIKYLLGLTSLLLIITVCAAFTFTKENNYDLARQKILFREIGHEILRHSGDSTSRVLPVQEIAENEYQIRFENEFTFQSDSLVKIVNRTLAKDNLIHNYIVSVLSCAGKDVIFGYAMADNVKDDIIPCSGRKQPRNCYVIDLKFQQKGFTTAQKGYSCAGIFLLAFIGFVISGPVKKKKQNILATSTIIKEGRQIGHTAFDPQKRRLIINEITIELTVKENKLLQIFADSPNTIIERSRLQKEIWENEGVIVGRSLDVFISKLRKKLEHDNSIQLVNIHGKGYKLRIGGGAGI
jgi:DNA-binding winged helix-turn-helix (wHTH) protein